jgi:hypothetical protein
VNRQHLAAFLWLRWRLAVNQARRAGVIATVINTLFVGLMVGGAFVGIAAGFLVGLLVLAEATPMVMLVVWNGAVAGFTFFWLIGLMAELQSSELLSLDRFLHLPVSPRGAFLINYIGSSLGLSLILFLPAMIGLASGLVFSRGVGLWVLFPLIGAFFLMVTGVTYQFRGWLASMMANPRRRRAIVGMVTLAFILVFQIPNIVNTFSPASRERREARAEIRRVVESLEEDFAAGRITREELEARRPPPFPRSQGGPGDDISEDSLRQVDLWIPLGWLPYGAHSALGGGVLAPLASALGMGLIGVASLGRAYRTTIRHYTGDFDSGRRARAGAAVAAPAGIEAPSDVRARTATTPFLEWRLPGISEGASAVALATFRGLVRAPELRMILLSPVIMLVVFGGMFAGGAGDPPELLRALVASGFSAGVLLFGMLGFIGNQFGFDRTGFRAFVLAPTAREEILLGKNLAFLPVGVAMMALAASLYQWFLPMRVDHFLAVLVQTVPMYLVFCLAANLLSILSPMALKTGTGMPARNQGVKMLYQLLFMTLIPMVLGITLLPLGVEALLEFLGDTALPAYLVLGILQAVLTVILYRIVLGWEGRLLQDREQRILEVVGSTGE